MRSHENELDSNIGVKSTETHLFIETLHFLENCGLCLRYLAVGSYQRDIYLHSIIQICNNYLSVEYHLCSCSGVDRQIRAILRLIGSIFVEFNITLVKSSQR